MITFVHRSNSFRPSGSQLSNFDPYFEGAASGEAADPHLEGVTFGWMGSTDPDGAHYWRIGGRGFWSGEGRFGIEYSAPQSDPAHVHALWRALSSER